MIREDLLDLKYYLNSLSLFMRESYGISEQTKTFHSLLVQVNEYYDEFFEELDFFNHDALGEMLDKIGAIFGCSRKFTIPIYDETNIMEIVNYAQIDLNDDEYLIYIKTQAIKQYFDGSREMLQRLYSTYEDGKVKPGILDLVFLYTTEEDESGAICTIRWDTDITSGDLPLLFENGYLTIESLGIRYRRQITSLSGLAYYAKLAYSLVGYSEEPSDWATSDAYCKIMATGQATSVWDSTKTYAKVGINEYAIIPNEPANWQSSFSQYVIVTITPKSAGEAYVPGEFYKAPTLGQMVYGRMVCSPLSQEPSDWSAGGYYSVYGTATSVWLDENDYAVLSGSDYVLVPSEPANWETAYSDYVVLHSTDGSETFSPGNFYGKPVRKGGLYA